MKNLLNITLEFRVMPEPKIIDDNNYKGYLKHCKELQNLIKKEIYLRGFYTPFSTPITVKCDICLRSSKKKSIDSIRRINSTIFKCGNNLIWSDSEIIQEVENKINTNQSMDCLRITIYA